MMKEAACLIVFFLIAMGNAIAVADDIDRKTFPIVGGTDAGKNSWPWIVSLQQKGFGSAYDSHTCGASLIGSRWVLTAAHCIVGMSNDNADLLEVRVGGYNLARNQTAGQRIGIKRILQHPLYDDDTTDNDIALLELKRDSGAQTISLIDEIAMQQISHGTSLSVAGWGQLSENNSDTPAQLQQVDIPFVDLDTCRAARNGEDGDMTQNMICAGPETGGQDSCYGDSGGPLMLRENSTWSQVGLVSWGVECAGKNQYGVYTRLANYNDWIDQHKRHLSQDTLVNLLYFPVDMEVRARVKIYNNSSQAQTVVAQEISQKKGVTARLRANSCLNTSIGAGENCRLDVAVRAQRPGPVALSLTSAASQSVGRMETVVQGEALIPFVVQNPIDQANLSYYTSSKKRFAWRELPGKRALRSRGAEYPDYSPAQVVVRGPAVVNFQWRVSRDLYDYALVAIDGVITGTEYPSDRTWDDVTLRVPFGKHRITWLFQKSDEAPQQNRYLMIRDLTVEP